MASPTPPRNVTGAALPLQEEQAQPHQTQANGVPKKEDLISSPPGLWYVYFLYSNLEPNE